MRYWILLSALALGACAAETFAPVQPVRLVILDGEGQRAGPGAWLPRDVVVAVTDADGRPATGVPVHWAADDDGSTSSGPFDSTDMEGQVRTRWRLGAAYGTQRLRAIVGDLPAAVIEADAAALEVEQLWTGFFFGCGIDIDQRTWCWGDNGYRQLGDEDRSVVGPRRIGEDSLKFVELSLGNLHACGRTATGEVWCWGGNDSGQHGDDRALGLGTGWAVPRRVPGLPSVRRIVSDLSVTCALSTTDDLWCWGSGAGLNSPHAIRPFPGITFRQVDISYYHGCGVTTAGAVVCWGDNFHGQLGIGTTGGSRATPIPIARAIDTDSVAVGTGGSCAVDRGGSLYCWGRVAGIGGAERSTNDPGYPSHIPTPTLLRRVTLGLYCGALWPTAGAPLFLCSNGHPDVEGSGISFLEVQYGGESLCVLTPERTVHCKSYSDTSGPPYFHYTATTIPAP